VVLATSQACAVPVYALLLTHEFVTAQPLNPRLRPSIPVLCHNDGNMNNEYTCQQMLGVCGTNLVSPGWLVLSPRLHHVIHYNWSNFALLVKCKPTIGAA